MEISLSEAKARLTALVRPAEAGEDVILTRHGRPAVRLVPVKKPLDRAARRKLIEEIQEAAARDVTPGPDAAHSQDFLYDEYGLPR